MCLNFSPHFKILTNNTLWSVSCPAIFGKSENRDDDKDANDSTYFIFLHRLGILDSSWANTSRVVAFLASLNPIESFVPVHGIERSRNFARNHTYIKHISPWGIFGDVSRVRRSEKSNPYFACHPVNCEYLYLIETLRRRRCFKKYISSMTEF